MRVRMKHQRSGGRYDGQPWPERGESFDVPDDEGTWLIEQDHAEAVEPPAPRRGRPPKSAADPAEE